MLVQHIGQSVGALDSLFASLMDISRLDAGAIRVNKTAFPLQPLLDRIVRDYTGEAHEKNIELRLHPTRSVVMTDAVLLERILRNLISNAVRYTQEGRVVVLCRPAGQGVSLQVWDTGCGIPADEQTRVFDEFYQLQRRDGAAGLGLGLSIVQRLSTLLALDLKLRSQPGRGSCFSLMLPVAAEATPARSPAGQALERGRILVIDDNPAITQSMAALLSSWGYEVATALDADGAAACSMLPDLVVCDYHLGPTTGLAVVAALRARFARPIAAMLITADTSPDVAYAAEAHGLVLLHKPVSNARLRASIRRALMHEHGLAVSA
jgi:CheY-like chemotaxis protein/anti-sigma regulatory factor (Ser/Thr protein kinase)